MRANARSTPWTTLFFALLGLAWCGYVAFPTATPAPCSTSGCALFRDSKVAGLSLWWIGGAYFFLLAVVCLKGNHSLARLLAGIALFLDAILLVIMFLTAPCFDCLVVAVFMGISYFTLRPSAHTDGWFTGAEPSHSLLLPIWFGLLLGNIVLAANEQLPAYNVGNTQSTELSVYFSPSCPACREALISLGKNAALYPVQEEESDFDSILRLSALLKAGIPMEDALRRCLDSNEAVPNIPFYTRAILQMQLLRNKAALMRQGFRALPLIQVNGMPGAQPNTPLNSSSMTREQLAPGSASASALPQQGNTPPQSSAYAEQPGDPFTRQQPAAQSPGGTLHDGADALDGLPDFLDAPGSLRQCGGDNALPCD